MKKMTLEQFKEQFNIKLNNQQLKAVQSVQNPTLLLAVPGSGKTTVLVTRLGYMIYCLGIEPESILTITYTVAATNYMRQRFETMFGEQLAARLEFRTINGICSKIINYYGNCIGRKAFDLITDHVRDHHSSFSCDKTDCGAADRRGAAAVRHCRDFCTDAGVWKATVAVYH